METEEESRRATFFVQKLLSITIVTLFATLIVGMSIRIGVVGDSSSPVMSELLKQFAEVLKNLVLLVFGYWIGNAKAAQTKDEQMQRAAEKLASKVIDPSIGTPWWSKMNEVERAAIKAAEDGDPRVLLFRTTAEAGRATEADLAYMVELGLITKERESIFKSTP